MTRFIQFSEQLLNEVSLTAPKISITSSSKDFKVGVSFTEASSFRLKLWGIAQLLHEVERTHESGSVSMRVASLEEMWLRMISDMKPSRADLYEDILNERKEAKSILSNSEELLQIQIALPNRYSELDAICCDTFGLPLRDLLSQ